MDDQKDPGIRIDQIFVNRVAFEHIPESMALPAGTPAAEHQITIMLTTALREDGKAGMMTLTVQTSPENRGQYRFTVELVALVSEDEANANLSVAEYMKKAPAATLYPFIREAVASLTGRGRFGSIYLKPVNFQRKPDETITREQLEKKSPTS